MKHSACRSYACMQALGVADVLQACLGLLDARPRTALPASPQHVATR